MGDVAHDKHSPNLTRNVIDVSDKHLRASDVVTSSTVAPDTNQPKSAPTHLWRLPEYAKHWPLDCQVIQLIECDARVRKLWNRHIVSYGHEMNPSLHSEQSVSEFLLKLA